MASAILACLLARDRRSAALALLFFAVLAFTILNGLPPVRHVVASAVGISPVAYPAFAVAAAFVAIALCAFAAERVSSSAVVMTIGIACLGFLSAVMAGGEALAAWALTIALPAGVFIALLRIREKDVRYAWRALELALFVAVLAAVLRFLVVAGVAGLTPSFVDSRHTATEFWALAGAWSFGNPNNASVIYLAALGVALRGLAGGRHLSTYVVYAAVAGLAVYVTGSRGAYMMAVVLLVLFLLVTRRPRAADISARRFRSTIGLLVVSVLVFVLALAAFDVQGSLVGNPSVAHRITGRQLGITAMLQNPLLGSGPASSTEEMTLLSRRTPGTPTGVGAYPSGASAHDFFANFGVDLGLPALVLLLCLLLIIFRVGWQNSRADLLPLLGFLLSATAAGVSMLSLSNPAWAVLFWVLAGLAYRQCAGSEASAAR